MNLARAYFIILWCQSGGDASLKPTAVHIGNLIKEYLANEPKAHTVTWFAKRLNCHRVNVYDIFRRSTIDTALLWRISTILNHNFFLDMADDFQKANASAPEIPDKQ